MVRTNLTSKKARKTMSNNKTYWVECGCESVEVEISEQELKNFYNDDPFIGTCTCTGEKLCFNSPWNLTVEEA